MVSWIIWSKPVENGSKTRPLWISNREAWYPGIWRNQHFLIRSSFRTKAFIQYLICLVPKPSEFNINQDRSFYKSFGRVEGIDMALPPYLQIATLWHIFDNVHPGRVTHCIYIYIYIYIFVCVGVYVSVCMCMCMCV